MIGGNVGGIRRQIIQGVTGYLVNTVEGMSWRLRELLGDPERARHMGELGRQQIRQNFYCPTASRTGCWYTSRWAIPTATWSS